MHRREFIGLNVAFLASLNLDSFALFDRENGKTLCYSLLKDWCEGMLAFQISEPEDVSRDGALWCAADQSIHGRCMDALYPFSFMYSKTGNEKYRIAAEKVFNWAENNVSWEDGSWTVMPNPKTWKGISIFGAIALAETLKYHEKDLPESFVQKLRSRLEKASEFILKEFTMTFTNINYGISAVYGLWLCGEVLHSAKCSLRSRELAKEIKNWFTEPNTLLYGEGKPSNKKSPKGLYGIDLGYNVEETLNAAVLYALESHDQDLQNFLVKTLEGHLDFMLPDGAWDNSWGSRQFKWTYWGSRTTEGCQPAFLSLAHLQPAFGKAAFLNTNLLQTCTHNKLLHGGPHFHENEVLPCMHHTFCHAKALASVLNLNHNWEYFNANSILPREKSKGIKEFSELDLWQLNSREWTSTISAYDFEYVKNSQAATGGSLAILYHKKLGLVCTASMAQYFKVEPFNQQDNPNGVDFALTPRIELFQNGIWYTNLFDRTAIIRENSGALEVQAKLFNEHYQVLEERPLYISYRIVKKAFQIEITAPNNERKYQFVLPIVAKKTETFTFLNSKKLVFQKEQGTLRVLSDHDMKTSENRVFNLVPGVGAVPITISFSNSLRIQIESF